MEVSLTVEQEHQLTHFARHAGKPVGQLLTECATTLLDRQSHYLEEIRVGFEAAERGEFVEEREMDARVAAMLRG